MEKIVLQNAKAKRTAKASISKLAHVTSWAETIPSDEWAVYLLAIQALRRTGRPFLLGGAFGMASYTGRWRNTKDIDLIIHPKDRDALVAALLEAGFDDYYAQLPYDRRWIYRSTRKHAIVDLIWAMANQRAQVDDQWFEKAQSASFRQEEIMVAPAEEILWQKIFVLQRDRCDWPDGMNLLYAVGPQLDWDRLVQRFGEDLPLLHGLLSVFNWLCPKRASQLPVSLRKRFGLPRPSPEALLVDETHRLQLLDSRPWFVTQPS